MIYNKLCVILIWWEVIDPFYIVVLAFAGFLEFIYEGEKVKLLKKLTAALIVCSCLFNIAACSEDDGSGGIFKYNIPANPQSLDPQYTADSVSDLLISNIFMGLLTANPDGSISSGVAEDYIVSDDGLVYSFKLRQDIYWIDSGDFEAQCTAHDFVFAFQRLFNPETRAVRASDYFCIKNSELVNKGVIPDVSQIGVSAKSDFGLEIILDYPNPRFPLLLTKTPAMPCNEEYFNLAGGKYGLAPEATPSNGSFYLKTWDYDPYTITENNHMILRRNYKTSEISRVYPSGLNFFIVDEKGFVEDFITGTTDCIAVTDEEAINITGEEFTSSEYSNISVGVVFNNNYELFSHPEFRKALAGLVNRDEIQNSIKQYGNAQGVVPSEVTLLNIPYREYADDVAMIQYDSQAAYDNYLLVDEQIDKDQLVGARIIMPDETMKEAVSYIMQEWQRVLGFYCVVEVLSVEEYEKRLSSGDFELAVVELVGGYNSPEAYLSAFTSNSSSNYSDYFNLEFQRFMSLASRAVDLETSADYYIKAETLLIEDAGFIPLCSKNEYFFTGEDVWDIYYNPFTKAVDFSKAKIK